MFLKDYRGEFISTDDAYSLGHTGHVSATGDTFYLDNSLWSSVTFTYDTTDSFVVNPDICGDLVVEITRSNIGHAEKATFSVDLEANTIEATLCHETCTSDDLDYLIIIKVYQEAVPSVYFEMIFSIIEVNCFKRFSSTSHGNVIKYVALESERSG